MMEKKQKRYKEKIARKFVENEGKIVEKSQKMKKLWKNITNYGRKKKCRTSFSQYAKNEDKNR